MYFVSLDELIELNPEVLVFDGLFIRRSPPISFPIMNPLGDSLPEVLGIGVEVYNARFLESTESLDGSLQLHLIVRCVPLTAREFLLLSLEAKDSAPSTGPRVS
jgi:hypothetical protein